MELTHSFTVPARIDDAWQTLLDIERIAPCLPGAAIDSVDGDDFTGTVKVKLGPISLTYKGNASFIEKDVVAHRAVIHARGRDARGNGTATATVTATLAEDHDSTTVDVVTQLDITGKPAQFGRGVMSDVGGKLIGQFADCLAAQLSGAAQLSAPPVSAEQEPEPVIDLVESAGPAIAKRLAPIALVVVLLWFVRRRRRR
jgi:carbon monoxide dehydrogenase subunit G